MCLRKQAVLIVSAFFYLCGAREAFEMGNPSKSIKEPPSAMQHLSHKVSFVIHILFLSSI